VPTVSMGCPTCVNYGFKTEDSVLLFFGLPFPSSFGSVLAPDSGCTRGGLLRRPLAYCPYFGPPHCPAMCPLTSGSLAPQDPFSRGGVSPAVLWVQPPLTFFEQVVCKQCGELFGPALRTRSPPTKSFATILFFLISMACFEAPPPLSDRGFFDQHLVLTTFSGSPIALANGPFQGPPQLFRLGAGGLCRELGGSGGP